MPAGAVVLVLVAVAPAAGARAGADDRGGADIFAADAEAWAFSVEVGIPGPLGPLTSHTTASIDNSPHAVGAAGLADPGLLVRTVGEVTLGVPTPAYCGSASPEGPREANCAAPDKGEVRVGRAHTVSRDRPEATSKATYGRVLLNEAVAPPATVIGVNSQSTMAVTTATESGPEARSSVALQGVSLAGGALRIESFQLTRVARADGTDQGSTTSSEVALSGLWVAGEKVDPGRHALQALIAAARAAYGDRLQVSSGELVEQRTPDGRLYGRTSGLVVRWQPSPGRWVRAVLGYVGVMAYGVPVAADRILDTVVEAEVPVGAPGSPIEGRRPAVPDDVGSLQPPVRAPASPAEAGVAGREAATGGPGGVASAGTAPPPTDDMAESATPTALGATTPYRRPALRWGSPFLVLAEMASGSQVGWFVAALVPLLLVRRLWRRAARAPASAAGAKSAEASQRPSRRTPHSVPDSIATGRSCLDDVGGRP